MKNKKLKLLILLILSIILFYVINSYGMNYNSGSYVNDLIYILYHVIWVLFQYYLLVVYYIWF